VAHQLRTLQTWDNSSLFVHGERVLFWSGEYHPFRLPVPGLWLDVFQKIKALGYSGVSFYTDWALLEGKQGVFNASGIFALEPFFEAAQQAGIYLLAVSSSLLTSIEQGLRHPIASWTIHQRGGFGWWLPWLVAEKSWYTSNTRPKLSQCYRQVSRVAVGAVGLLRI